MLFQNPNFRLCSDINHLMYHYFNVTVDICINIMKFFVHK